MRKIILSFLLMVFVFSIEGLSAPSLSGTSGLIEMPSAFGLKYKEYNLSCDYLLKSGQDSGDFTYNANIGTFKGLEMGLIGTNKKEGVFINMKYYLLSDYTNNPFAVAIGLNNLSSYTQSEVYLVASKAFEAGFDGHFGFKGKFTGGQVDTSVMLGFEFYFLNKYISVITDTIGEKANYNLNLGVNFNIHPKVLIKLTGKNILDSNKTGVYYGLGVCWTQFMN